MKKKIILLSGFFFFSFCVGLAFAQPEDSNFIQAAQDFAHLNGGEKEVVLSSLGLPGASSFSWAKLLGGFLFGGIGFIAFVYGKKQQHYRALGIGIALMAYPYFIGDTLWLYIIGIGLCLALYFWRD